MIVRTQSFPLGKWFVLLLSLAKRMFFPQGDRMPVVASRHRWVLVAVLGGVAIALALVSSPAEAQELRTFRWEDPKTVCDDGQPGSDRLPFENGTHLIPADQFARRCKLRMVWTTSAPPRGFNVPQEAVLQRRGEVVTPTGQRLSFLGSFRDGNTVASEIFLSQLPAETFRAGMRVRRANGEVHTANPAFYAFGRGGETVTEPPRITSFRINGGAASTSNAVLRLDLRTTGAQPTQIMIGERPGPGFRGARWQYYRPTTGAGGGRQTYTLQNRTSGRKTIHVKVRAGGVESESVFDSIDFVVLADYDVEALRVLEVAEASGFRHVAQPFGASVTCEIKASDGQGLFLSGNVGDRCRFTLFSGRTLARGWSVRRFQIEQHNGFKSEVERQPNGRVVQAQVIAEKLPVKGRLFQVPAPLSLTAFSFRMTLRGPAGQTWEAAFER